MPGLEVWAGEWVEFLIRLGERTLLMPRTSRPRRSSSVAYAALNLIGIEVLEARRAVPEFQKDPAALAAALCAEFNGQDRDALGVALDAGLLVDLLIGDGGMERAECNGPRSGLFGPSKAGRRSSRAL